MTSATQTQNNSNTGFRNALGNNQAVSKATQFAKQRPFATATLAGVVGLALLNTLRGKGATR